MTGSPVPPTLVYGGNCVEVAVVFGVIAVRDSKDPDGPVLLPTRVVLRTAVQSATDKH